MCICVCVCKFVYVCVCVCVKKTQLYPKCRYKHSCITVEWRQHISHCRCSMSLKLYDQCVYTQAYRDFFYIGNRGSPERQPIAFVRVIYEAATGIIDLKTLCEGLGQKCMLLRLPQIFKRKKVSDFIFPINFCSILLP